MDPNEADIKDAILVHCDMEKRATCVYPSPNKSSEITYIGDKPEVWLGDVEGGFSVSILLFPENVNKYLYKTDGF